MNDAENSEAQSTAPRNASDAGRITAVASLSAAGYRVLARKYRPANFDDLIGQDAMVRTLSNAFESGRIPQAWILTGVRGVGKTTTARILARALNYELPDGSVTGPTIAMPTLGVHCQAIMESRHIDVIEMDAASHNGVDDVRQINDAVRYAPVSARTKVYILDEVHMLSGAAFNALLKTLEEPPPHAKFIFATTEIRKVPVTVLSRCQRFDLRRVDAEVLVRHLQGIADKEAITIEPDALALIARAAEGSVRDLLSLLDQAIAHAAGAVRAEDVRADARPCRPRPHHRPVRGADARRYRRGAEGVARPVRHRRRSGGGAVRLAEFTNFVTRVKVVPAVAEDAAFAEAERTRGRDFAAKLSMRVLSRTWQMLLKGLAEVQSAGPPDRRRGDGAGPHRLCRRSADPGRGDPLLEQRGGRVGAPPSGNGGPGGTPRRRRGQSADAALRSQRAAVRVRRSPRESGEPAPATAEAPAKPSSRSTVSKT